jgi:hypothetical protein
VERRGPLARGTPITHSITPMARGAARAIRRWSRDSANWTTRPNDDAHRL